MKLPAMSSIRQRRLSILSFSLFSVWLLSFLFKGRVFFELVGQADVNVSLLVQTAVLPHFVGLFLCGFLAKKASAGKMVMVVATIVCFSGNLIFLLPYSMLWYLSLGAMGFFSALFVAAWGYFLKLHTPSELRLRTVADVLILTNILMIAVNALAVEFSPLVSLAVLQIFLAGSLLITFRLKTYPEGKTAQSLARVSTTAKIAVIYKPLAYLSFFILVFTINSGFMFQVVKPAFAHHEILTAYYWALPYTAAIAIIRSLPRKISIAYLLYAAIIMIGLAYLAFMWLDRSVASYLIINTLLLGAFGVCDLFWWSIMGSIFDFTDNPAQVFGIGLSMNVLGVILGGFLGGYLMTLADGYFQVSKVALTVLFTVMLMLPIVNYQLTRLLKRHAFLIEFASGEEQNFDKALAEFKETCQLTDKEGEVVELLLCGYTYKAISDHMLISENTLKFHIKNLYQKLRINNKMELIRMFANNRVSK